MKAVTKADAEALYTQLYERRQRAASLSLLLHLASNSNEQINADEWDDMFRGLSCLIEDQSTAWYETEEALRHMLGDHADDEPAIDFGRLKNDVLRARKAAR